MIAYVFPGQGSQVKGMGQDLFDKYPDIIGKADKILGYSLEELCLIDPKRQLGQTQFTQPALYTINVLTYLEAIKIVGRKPDYVAGHSLGEYSALFAAGVFDFETGLRLVKKRGELMGQATGGGMAAVIGLNESIVEEILRKSGFANVKIANYNSPKQFVISGRIADIDGIADFFDIPDAMFIPLNVSGAFHSQYMTQAKQIFAAYLDQFKFAEIAIPVISNVSARPYKREIIKQVLADQMTNPVNWTESIRYLMGLGVAEYVEIGPGNVLTKLIQQIRQQTEPLVIKEDESSNGHKTGVGPVPIKRDSKPPDSGLRGVKEKDIGEQCFRRQDNEKREMMREERSRQQHGSKPDTIRRITATYLGDDGFKRDYNLKYAYLTGGMYRGIASKEMVARMGKAGMMGFFGTGGLDIHEIEAAIIYIQKELTDRQPYGINFLHNPTKPKAEEQVIDLLIKCGVRNIEAAAFMNITYALIKYRAQGIRRNPDGTVSTDNHIIAKISRPEVAESFLSPAPKRLTEKMVMENKITREQADLLMEIPMADDLCAEADSGGPTDAGVAYAMMPTMIKLRDEIVKEYKYPKRIRIGAAGGIGTPEAAAAAFILGADFILTGSINQCTVEAGTSDAVKDLLQQINIQDTDYAPSGDMFEMGARAQVLRRGVFFPARANKLYDLYRQFDSLDDIDEKTKKMLQERYFKRTFEEIFEEVKTYCSVDEIEKLERSPKQKMAVVFKWYFNRTTNLALTGSPGQQVDYQIQCGPALGAFNQWVKGTDLEDWRNRHVDEIGKKLMEETAEILNQRIKQLYVCTAS